MVELAQEPPHLPNSGPEDDSAGEGTSAARLEMWVWVPEPQEEGTDPTKVSSDLHMYLWGAPPTITMLSYTVIINKKLPTIYAIVLRSQQLDFMLRLASKQPLADCPKVPRH